MISSIIRFSMLIAFSSISCLSCDSSDNLSIQSKLDDLVRLNDIPGANFSIVYSNGEQQNFSSGFADTIKHLKLDTHHVLFSGSIGKTYAVAVLMQLIEERRIDLKSYFLEYFPSNDWLLHIPNIQNITIEMLMQHTSGLPRYISAQAVWDSLQNNPDKTWDYQERLSFIFQMNPVHNPGKGWAYSDTNYLLLGMLIEKITGTYYYDEVRRRILVPANLENTHPAIQRVIDDLPVGYSNLDDFFRMPGIVVSNGKYIFNPQMEWTGGGFASTTSDLAKWAQLYYENVFFSRTSLLKIITPNSHGLETGPNEAYGMGSFIFNTKLGKAYGHTGFVPGFNSIFAYFPDHEIAVALQINCDYASRKTSLVAYLETLLEGVVNP